MTIYGAQWVKPDGSMMKLSDIKLDPDVCTEEEMIYLHDPDTGFVGPFYYYLDVVEDMSLPMEDWVFLGPGWATVAGEAVDFDLPAGSAYFLSTPEERSFTASGAVLGSDVGSITTVGEKMSLYAMPFPIAGSIQNIKLDPDDCSEEEMIYLHDPENGYVGPYYYYLDIVEDMSLPMEDWVFLGPGWATVAGEAVNVSLAIGQGFWLSTPEERTFTVDSPLIKK